VPCQLHGGQAKRFTRPVGRVFPKVGNMDEPLPADEATQRISPVRAERLAQEVCVDSRYGVKRDCAKEIPVIAIEHPVRGLAQVCGLVEHRLEHRRKVAG